MLNGIIGKKIGMTQLFSPDGTVTPGTVIKAGPCVVVQAKSVETDVVTNLAITSTQVELIRAANLIAPTAEEAELQALATREWTTRRPEEQAAATGPNQPPAAAAPVPAATAPRAPSFWQTS